MLYFKNKDGVVFAYETQEDRDEFGSSDLVQIEPAEVDALIKKEHAYPLIATLDFLALFAPERRAIKQAAMHDVDIGIWYDDTVAAQFVTYADPRAEAGLSALVAANLLTPERKAEIVSQMQPR